MVDLILRVQYVFVIPGLHLILNINQAEYIAGLGDSAGARIVIHHQSRMPHPEDDGYNTGTRSFDVYWSKTCKLYQLK